MLKLNIKYALYLFVFIGFSYASANSFDAFFTAAKRNDVSTLSSLIARGFDANSLDDKGEHALLIAMRADAQEVVKLLLRVPKLRIDARSPIDETPLMLAALKGRADWVQDLLKLDADVNKPGWTPLHYAATGGHTTLVKLLLDQHAYIDAESPNKSTPLMMAAMYGNVETVQLLLDEGADWRLKNEKGLQALDFAVSGGRPDAAKLLRQVQAASTSAPSAQQAAPSSAQLPKQLPRGSW